MFAPVIYSVFLCYFLAFFFFKGSMRLKLHALLGIWTLLSAETQNVVS